MAWFYLLAAAACEIAWAIGLKASENFTRLWISIATVILMLLSFILLARAMRDLPAGTAYAVWTGIGAAGTAIVGIFLFKESSDPRRLICIGLILAGVVGLKVFMRDEASGQGFPVQPVQPDRPLE